MKFRWEFLLLRKRNVPKPSPPSRRNSNAHPMNHLFGSGRRRIINLDELGTHSINQLKLEEVSFSDGSSSCNTSKSASTTRSLTAEKKDEKGHSFGSDRQRIAVVTPSISNVQASMISAASRHPQRQATVTSAFPHNSSRGSSYRSVFPDSGSISQEALHYEDFSVEELEPLVHRQHGFNAVREKKTVACGLCRKLFPSKKVKIQLPCGHYLALAELPITAEHVHDCLEESSDITNINRKRGVSVKNSRCSQKCCPFFTFCIK